MKSIVVLNLWLIRNSIVTLHGIFTGRIRHKAIIVTKILKVYYNEKDIKVMVSIWERTELFPCGEGIKIIIT